jgi:probable HAF family extracellular repeat protein
MQSRILTCITAFTLFAALAIPVWLAAQEQPTVQSETAQHTRHKLIDLGTLGGPTSYNGIGSRILNDAGTISTSADTSIPDPNAPNLCFNPDCFLSHAFRWQDGVLTDLGALPGVNSSAAGAINARGWSAGQSQNGLIDPLTGFPVIRAVLWKDDQIVDLGTLGTGIESLALSVNDGGEVIGFSTIDTTTDPFASSGFGPFASPTHAFIWRNGTMQDLGTLGGPDSFPGSGCDNQRNGLVAGASFTNSTPNLTTGLPTIDPFLWDNGTMTDLGTLGGTFGFASCANNRGQVTGTSNLAGDAVNHPFLWDRGVLRDLGTLGGDFGTPNWINDAGDVVGAAGLVPGSNLQHAFLWRHGVMMDLGSLGTNSNAFAINSKGQIVGRSRISGTPGGPAGVLHAFLWENGGPMIDLNALIPANSGLELVEADNINESGEIVGLGAPPGVPVHQDAIGLHLFLLIPCAAEDTQGCEDNAEVTNAATQTSTAAVIRPTQTKTTPESRPTPSGVAAWRTRLAHRYHIPGLGASMQE